MKKVLKSFMFALVGMLTIATLVACGEKEHEHDYTYESLATKHRQVCKDCDDKQPWEPHVFKNEWVVTSAATEDAKGSHYRNCTVCGYKETEDIPMLLPATGVATEATAVYVQALADWAEVNIYYWGNTVDGESTLEEAYAVAWPGVEMTLVDETTHLYGFKVPKGTANVIFTDGSAQTVDIKFATGKNLYVVEEGENAKALEIHYSTYTPKDTDPELGQAVSSVVEKMTVYAKLPATWENHNIHYWGTKITTTWPGAEMTLLDKDENFYKYEGLPVGSTIIFNCAASADELEPIQTGNLTVPEGVNTFIIEDEDTVSYGKFENGVFTPVEVEFETPELYIRGDMNSWGTPEEAKFAYDEKNDKAILTVTLVEGHQFKIADASWGFEKKYEDTLIDAFIEGDGGNIKVAKAGTYTFIVEGLKAKASLQIIEMMDLYVQAPTSWTAVNLHYWGTAIGSSWPGAAMTLVEGKEDLYSVCIPAGSTVIVNNKVGDDGGQTSNLVIPADVNTLIVADNFSVSYGNYADGTLTPVEVAKEAPVLYVRGDMNEWGASDEYKLLYDSEKDTATIEVILTGGQSFKIADASWSTNFGYVDTLSAAFAEGSGGNINVVTGGTYVITVTDLLGTPTLTIVAKP